MPEKRRMSFVDAVLKWRAGKIDAFDLIHHLHLGREMLIFYLSRNINPAFLSVRWEAGSRGGETISSETVEGIRLHLEFCKSCRQAVQVIETALKALEEG